MHGSSKQILFLPFKDFGYNPHSHHCSCRGLNIPMQCCTILDNTPRNLLFYYSMCIRGINPCSLELQECKHEVLLGNLQTNFSTTCWVSIVLGTQTHFFLASVTLLLVLLGWNFLLMIYKVPLLFTFHNYVDSHE